MIFRMNLDRAEHVAAEIRGNIRDARIQQVLAQTEAAREVLLSDRLERVIRSTTAVGTAIEAVDVAAESVRTSLHSLGVAAASSREAIYEAVNAALILLEAAAQDARATLEEESGIAELRPGEKPS